MFTTILFLLVLTVLVFVHELGHFLLAKKVGARVDEFAIGFPPRLFSFKRGETVYAFNLIPFGGYVKIFGEDGDVEGDTSRSLAQKPRHLQILVLAAGIIFNIIFAWLLLSAAFMIGLPSSVDNYFNAPVSNPRVTVLSVSPNSPASKAGITANVVIDEVIADGTLVSPLNVKNIQDAITQTKKDVVIIYSSATSSVEFENTVTIKPTRDLVPDRNTIGISMDEIGTVKLPLIKAILAGSVSIIKLSMASAVAAAWECVTG
jgi:regulator of sigma E protease